ncbi:MAG: serine/threonine protein kinase [Myxococcales bacterium]|nr:serine/threonine protein kinase [Myxococcales bacterium]
MTDAPRPPAAALAATELAGGGTLPGVGAPGEPAAPVGAPALVPGAAIGPFIVERKVGAGGMGEVYAAHDPRLDRRVAIKVLPRHRHGNDAATRLVREAQALAKLAHPNVVAVYEVGEADGRVFLAMQFVEGETLGAHLARAQPRWDEVVRLYVAAGRGLAAAHAAGLIHRDVKPANVLIDRAGHVAVTDFGVARAADDASVEVSGGGAPARGGATGGALSTDVTAAGAVIGTPAYMAPEQHAGRRATAASDQFGFCVALWQGLFGRHPFVPRDRGDVTSPFEYMALIGEGALVPPPGGHKVPRRIVRALTRGLAREPAARWPTMAALLAELEPRSPYRLAVIALAAVATLGAGAAVLMAVGDRGGAPACPAQLDARVATAWSPAQAQAVAAGFAATGRSYAATTAATTTAALDRYAARWRALAGDGCAAGPADPLAAARRQCLDRALVAVRTVAGALATAPRAELVDNAVAIVDGLPALTDCADAQVLGAVGAPTAAQAPAVARLDERLAALKVRADAGLLRDLDGELAALIVDADAVAWAPSQVAARILRGEVAQARLEPAGPLLREAAALAVAHHLERAAAIAWTALVQVAAFDRQADAVAAYTEIAAALAAATGDPLLGLRLRSRHGRALVRLQRLADGEAECRAVLDELRAAPAADPRDVIAARDCVIEAVVPAGKFDLVDALAAEAIADRRALAGDGHPAIADYLRTQAIVAQQRGDLDGARATYQAAMDLRVAAFGKAHIKYAESLGDLADFEPDPAKQAAMLAEAAAIAAASDSPVRRLIERNLQTRLGELALARHDLPAMRAHFDRAVELATASGGPASLELAIVLLGYGQLLASVDLDQGLPMLEKAIGLLDQLRSPRAIAARAALAIALSYHGRTAEAVPLLEQAVRDAPAATEPYNLALMRWSLAKALVATKGDRARARALAIAARDQLRPLGAPALVDEIDAWLRRRR